MNFNNKFDFTWGSNDGSEPSDQLKENGFTAGYKPPAGVFNWFWRKVMKCITELQSAANTLENGITTVQSGIPTKTSDLTNNSGFITVSSVPTKVSQLTNDSKYITQSSVPTKLSAFTNDSKYITQSSVPTKLSALTNDCKFIPAAGSGASSFAYPSNNTASGSGAFATGYKTNATGNYAATFGWITTAGQYQFALGYFNNPNTAPTAMGKQGSDATLFTIGNGTDSNNTSNAFRTTADGQSRGLKAFMGSGADFTEYFEWLDGNPNNEDRRGRFVTLDGKKIKLANSNEDYILGVISVRGGFIGNSASEQWQGKIKKDVFGEWLTQQVEIPEETDIETGEVIPARTVTQYVLNPDYDPEQEYISREYRKEWATVGLLGQVIVVDDGTCQVNGYCKPSIDGIATAAENGYRVMERIDETHIEVLIK